MSGERKRWTYKTENVTVDGNSQTVRMLTAGERRAFADMSKKIKAGEATGADLADQVLKFGTVDPTLTDEDIAAMPPDLYEACAKKIMELSGLGGGDVPDDGAEGGEKKAPDPARLDS